MNNKITLWRRRLILLWSMLTSINFAWFISAEITTVESNSLIGDIQYILSLVCLVVLAYEQVSEKAKALTAWLECMILVIAPILSVVLISSLMQHGISFSAIGASILATLILGITYGIGFGVAIFAGKMFRSVI